MTSENPIEFTCPRCQAAVTLLASQAAGAQQCKQCGAEDFFVPSAKANKRSRSEVGRLADEVQQEKVPVLTLHRTWQLFAMTAVVAVVMALVMQLIHQEMSRVVIGGYFIAYLIFIVLLTPAMISRWRYLDQRLKKIEQYRQQQVSTADDES